MNKIKSIISIIAAASLLSVNAMAKEVNLLSDKAEVLHKLDLIRGVSNNGFDPGLGERLTREAAVAAVLRVTGNEDNVYKENRTCSFTDVSEWAKPYVAYGESIDLCRGIEGAYFGAQEQVNIRQLCTMYLRILGYETIGDIYGKALETAQPLAMINENIDRVGTRSDLIDISYNSLYVAMYGSSTALVRYLVDTGATTLSYIAAAGDDGLLSAYYSSEPSQNRATDELRGDLEHAMSYSFADGSGTGMTVVTDAEAVERENISCRKIAVGKSLSFKLDDEYITSGDKYFTFVVKYFDNGADKIRVSYNVANMPYCNGYIIKTNTNVWKEARVVIKNAQFAHAQEDGADISIIAENEGGVGVDEYISEVMLVKQTPEEQHVNPLDVEPVITTAYITFDGTGQAVCMGQTTTGSKDGYNYTTQDEQDGQTCVAVGVNKRCVLTLDDDFMDPDDNNCTINVTYFDNGTDKFRYSYSTEASRYKDVWIQKTGTNTWITHSIDVSDASFMNRQDAGIDFSIWGVSNENSKTGDEQIYISRVEIIKK